jgi:hypothetical protein
MENINPEVLSVCKSSTEAIQLSQWMNKHCPSDPVMFSPRGRKVMYNPTSVQHRPDGSRLVAGHPKMHEALQAFFIQK